MIDEVARSLGDTALAADGAAGYFPALYSRVTRRVGERTRGGEFDDPAGMVRLVEVFAGHYLDAVPDGSARPRCWQATFDVAGRDDLLIVQHLLLGINAHVNHDLPLAVVEVAEERGSLAAVRSDFDTINDVLAEVQRELLRDLGGVARWTNTVAGLGGGRLFRFSLTAARTQAWTAAEQLHVLDASLRRSYVGELDRLVSVLAVLIATPPRPIRPLLSLARRWEDDDHERVVGRLLAAEDPTPD